MANNLYFTSDTHFFHKNIIKYSNRPFSCLTQMHDKMLQLWNDNVDNTDTVYHLGDLSFGTPEATLALLKALNFRQLVLVRGNHDNTKVLNYLQNNLPGFRVSADSLVELKLVDSTHLVLCHYALAVWNRSHHGSIHLHGHSHGTFKGDSSAKRMDVGVDTEVAQYAPVSLSTVMHIMNGRNTAAVDHHAGVVQR